MIVDSSWWPSRVKQGIHLLEPSQEKVEYAKCVAALANNPTVYAYRKQPR